MRKAMIWTLILALVVLASAVVYQTQAAMVSKGMGRTGMWKFYSAELDVPAGATTELVAAVTGKQIRVVGLVGVANVSGTVTLKSSTTAISGDIPVAACGGIVMPIMSAASVPVCAWATTAAGEALQITTVTCTFDGVLVYAVEQ